MSEETINGMLYKRYTKKGEGYGKWKVGQEVTTEVVTKCPHRMHNITVYYDVINRRGNIPAVIVAITMRKNGRYTDLWYKLDFVPGFGYWTSNVHRITRYIRK